jgi:putative membrane protein
VGEEAIGTSRVHAAVRAMTQSDVDAARLAQQRASSHDVKDFATRLVAEYQSDIDAIGDIAKAKKIDLEAAGIQSDPLLRAHKAAAKDTLERLRTLSGPAFDAAYLAAQRPAQLALMHVAQEGPQGLRDTDVGNVLRTVAQQARDRGNKVLGMLPKACGGDRTATGAAG